MKTKFEPLMGCCIAVATLVMLLAPHPLPAADRGDSAATANNPGADISDVYAFLDPNDNDQVVLIATVRGSIPAGENVNLGIFDSSTRYRFEIENTGDAKPDLLIDVTFSLRTAIAGPPGKEVLQVLTAQTASVKFTKLLDLAGGKVAGVFPAPTTNSSTATAANPMVVTSLVPTAGIQFYAGMTDDPFFFDIPAFQSFIASVRNGAPNPSIFGRARDSFAGYNVMSVALRIPTQLLRGAGGTKIGVAFYTQRQGGQKFGKNGEIKGSGSFITYDRMGNPVVSLGLIPFNRRGEYNRATPKNDAAGQFTDDVVATLVALGTNPSNIAFLKDEVITHGDYLRLETDKVLAPNSGTGGGNSPSSAFQNGRRLRDDPVDAALNVFTSGVATSDNVNANDVPLQNTFPFLALPHQPRTSGTVDDNTRN